MLEKFLTNHKVKCAFLGTSFFLFALCSQAQDDGAKPDKFFAGGSFGLSLGRYTLVSLNPQAGYRFNRFVAAGMGTNLIYSNQKEKYPNGRTYSKAQMGIIGLNAFTRLYPVQKFFLQLQGEENYLFGNIKYYDTGTSYKMDAEIVPSVLVGGGMATPTQRGAVLFTVLYDVLQNPDSPYGNRPIVNVGYNINF